MKTQQRRRAEILAEIESIPYAVQGKICENKKTLASGDVAVYHNLQWWSEGRNHAIQAAADPVGPENDRWILEMTGKVDRTVCAWGRHATFLNRQERLFTLLADRPLYYLEKTKDGIPKHPLYLRSDLLPKPLA